MFKIDGYDIFESIRNKVKGGTAIGIKADLKPVLIEEYSDQFELLVVEIKAGNRDIRIMSGYGPQENWPEADRKPFFLALEEEIIKAELAGKSVIIEMDANSKLGPSIISGDKHQQSENGKMLAGIIKRQKLVVGNNINQCKGVITRKRVTKDNTEESIIDFVLVSEDMIDEVESIVIDEERTHVLTRLTKTKRGITKVESDHNSIISKFKLSLDMKADKSRTEVFNLKNKEGQDKFKDATAALNNNNYLLSVFDTSEDINTQTKVFLKKLENIIHKCFRKIRIKEKCDGEKETLYKKWKSLKNKTDDKSRTEYKEVEEILARKYSKEYFEKIQKRTENMNSEDSPINYGSLWNLKKDLFPKSRDPPTAMLDPTTGNLLTSEEKIMNAAVNVYTKRLENKPMKDNLKNIKEAKELLCRKLLEVAKQNKTPPWEMHHLEKVLRNLKKGKSRDPYGYCNELFMADTAGDDLKNAILKMMNKIKDDQIYPECLQLCNISSIWKRKGPRNNFDSYRGIFRVTIFRNILDRLIYNDEYSKLDENLTDCNVGARKERNIRDNIFVINAIMNSIKNNKESDVDFQVYDVEKCFDTLWLHEVINCLFNAGLTNDKLPLLFMENESAQVAVKTGRGLSKRINVRNIIMQGSVFGSICCVVLMDKLGQLVYSNPELLYYYRGVVATPPLQMVDDVLGVQKCSEKSRRLNNTIGTFMELEKLTLSEKKCNVVHIGKNDFNCPELKVHDQQMNRSKQETYLGDKIDISGRLRPTIKSRISKGYGAINNILAITNEVPLAHWRICAGLRLRDSLFLNCILFNSEAWQGITNADIQMLEKVDEDLLRGLLKAHSKIPTEVLYLETGSIPIRFVLKSRRISYLQTILKRDTEELIKEIYDVQKNDPIKGDFYDLVMEDIRSIKLKITEEEITKMKKQKFKSIVKEHVRISAMEHLKQLQQNHSKAKKINYNKLELAQYMNSPVFSNDNTKLLLALRTRTVNGIRSDFSGMYSTLSCPLCGDHPDTLPNVLICNIMKKHQQTSVLSNSAFSYDDVFSQDVIKQKEITELFSELLKIREEIVNSTPVAITGPVH